MKPIQALQRAAVIDDDLLNALRRLLRLSPNDGEELLAPADLPKIEMALRAFITVDNLHMMPVLLPVNQNSTLRDDEDDAVPFHDHLLDYEFIYEPKQIPLLAPLEKAQRLGVDDLVERTLEKAAGKPFWDSTPRELRRELFGVSPRLGDIFVREVEDESSEENRGIVLSGLLNGLQEYASTLVRLTLGGAVIFSETTVAKACHEHIFSQYPQRIFEKLDERWTSYLRKVTGPGIGVSVPPVLACVLTRAAEKQEDIGIAIRDLREEYANSRGALWDHLEEMWNATDLKKQVQLLADLERASENLFQASFPERFPFLETAWDITADVSELRPLSAVTKVGKAVLGHSRAKGHVSAISFTRQLSRDLRKVAGLSRLLRPYLTTAEAIRFGIK